MKIHLNDAAMYAVMWLVVGAICLTALFTCDSDEPAISISYTSTATTNTIQTTNTTTEPQP